MIPLGIVLIILGMALIIGEFFTGSGLLAGTGVVSLIAGLVMLVLGTSPFQVEWWLALLICVAVAGMIAFAVLRIKSTYHGQVTTGKEDLKGKTAIVKELLDPEGTVLFQGELWNAISLSGAIEPGEEVIITGVEGLKLSVVKKEIRQDIAAGAKEN